MTEDRKNSGDTPFAHLQIDYLADIAERVASGAYIDGPELAERLRGHGSQPIPDKVLDYLCRYLEGTIDKPKGRKALPEFERRRQDMIVRRLYRRYFEYLTARKGRYGQPAGWTNLDYPSGEMAARLVAKRWLYGEESWHTVQNIASRKTSLPVNSTALL